MPAAGGARSWPLTGRIEEFEHLAALHADHVVGGAIVVGPAGVGKTRLVEDALDRAERAGEPVARAVGHETARDIPLAALTHLLPADVVSRIGIGPDERTALFHAAREAFAVAGDGRRLVLFVDDIDLLDDTSVALLVPLVLSRAIFLVGTVRSGRSPSARLAGLQRDGHLQRIELEPLDTDELSTLLHRALDAPVSADALAELQRLSGGNMQILTELVRGARDRGTLELCEGTWHLSGPVSTTTALDELVIEHLATVHDDGRRVLELLAVCERLGLADLERSVEPQVLESLERDGLVDVVESQRRAAVRLAHPLYGEVLAESLPPLRRRSIERQLADLVDAHGCRRRGDEMRVVLWRMRSGGEVDDGRRLRAARLALVAHDHELALRLAGPGLGSGATDEERADRLQILAEAAVLTGRSAAAEAHLVAAAGLDVSDRTRAQIAVRLAERRFFAGADLDRAIDAVVAAAAKIEDPSARASLDAERAVLLANAGRPAAALEVIERLPDDLEPGTAVDVAAARSGCLVAVGRCSEGAAAAREAAELQTRLSGRSARRGASRHLVNEVHAYGYAGHHRRALELLEPALERARAAGAWAAWVWFELVASEIHRDMGCGARSVEHAARVVEAAGRTGQHATLVWANTGVAQGHLLQGRCDDAERALRAAADVGGSPIATSAATLERGWAWLEACRGDLAGARARLAAVAEDVRRDGIFIFEAALRHDIARFGDPGASVDRLEELLPSLDGPVFAAFAAHARALADRDVEALARCADAFEEIECLGQAAECCAELVELRARTGDQRGAANAAHRLSSLVSRTGGLATPPLARSSGAEPLTAREREVALLAAGGAASREIADRLFVSTRTVDTHLARVYRKLGISGRSELAGAMKVDPTGH